MNKFQKAQKASSIVPFFSTFFITLATMIEFKKRRASTKLYIQAIVSVAASFIVAFFVNQWVLTGQHQILNYIAMGLLFLPANLYMVELQVRSQTEEHQHSGTDEKVTGKHTRKYRVYLGAAGAVGVMALAMILALLIPLPQIEDLNGVNNTALAQIAMEEIVSTDRDYTAQMPRMYHDGAHSEAGGAYQDIDYERVQYKCKKFSGVYTIQATRVADHQVTVEIDSTLTSGNLEFFIFIDGQFHMRLAGNKDHSILLDDVAGKLILLKIGGESAEFAVTISRH